MQRDGGVPDVGLLTLTEVAQLAGYVARAVKIPAIVDADTGFGGAENAARTIEEFERAGLAGCHIEDQEFPKRCGHLAGNSLVAIEDMNEKIAAAAAAKRDKDFLLIARTDARAVESFAKAVERAQSYLAGGRGCDFSGSAAERTGVPRFREGSESAVAREHDRVWQESLALVRPTGRSRLSHGHLSADGLSGVDVRGRADVARFEIERNAGRLARSDADAERTLRSARLRSDKIGTRL